MKAMDLTVAKKDSLRKIAISLIGRVNERYGLVTTVTFRSADLRSRIGRMLASR